MGARIGSKPFIIEYLPIGHLVKTTSISTSGTTNSYALMQQCMKSTVLKTNATSRDLYRTRFSVAPLPIGDSVWYHSFDSSWWLGKTKQTSDVPGWYIIRFLDKTGPVLIDRPPHTTYNVTLQDFCGSWC